METALEYMGLAGMYSSLPQIAPIQGVTKPVVTTNISMPTPSLSLKTPATGEKQSWWKGLDGNQKAAFIGNAAGTIMNLVGAGFDIYNKSKGAEVPPLSIPTPDGPKVLSKEEARQMYEAYAQNGNSKETKDNMTPLLMAILNNQNNRPAPAPRTPIGLYIGIGAGALLLMMMMVMMSNKK